MFFKNHFFSKNWLMPCLSCFENLTLKKKNDILSTYSFNWHYSRNCHIVSMLFLLINYIFSTQQLITPFKKGPLLQDDELECIYDRLYSSSINSNSVICLVRCTFSSIKTTSVGGDVVVNLRNRFGMKNYIDNCKSLNGSAIYFNIETNFRQRYSILNSRTILWVLQVEKYIFYQK